jgi:hypothetical protein
VDTPVKTPLEMVLFQSKFAVIFPPKFDEFVPDVTSIWSATNGSFLTAEEKFFNFNRIENVSVM